MRKNDPRYRYYLLRQRKKQERARIRSKQYRYRRAAESVEEETSEKPYPSHIPENFSIVHNSTETIRYFNVLIHHILRHQEIKKVFFDFSRVTRMTVDALMYLLAILKFLKCNIWEFSGNLPLDEKARSLFVQSGFLKKIGQHNVAIKPKGLMYMCSGHKADPIESSKICGFLHAHSNADRVKTGYLFDALMELEANTIDHAYGSNANSLFTNNWLASVEDRGDVFAFTFLDVGMGICKTIYKRWHEHVNLGKTQADYLLSAFEGKLMRTETRLHHRGKGLPKIKRYSDERKLSQLTVITNQAMCYATEEAPYLVGQKIEESLAGTVFYWEVPKSIFD